MAGGFILLVGSAASGKTRCAYEAINTVLGDWRLCMPASAERLTALVDSEVDLTHTVVWLNETQHFLGPGRLKAETVRRLLADRRRPVVLVGTIWPSEYSRLSSPGSLQEGQDLDEDSGEILKLTRRFTLREFSRSEQERAQELASADPRLAEAVAHGQGGAHLTEVLAAAPELVERWEQAADVYGTAVISAGLDARLCGHPEPLPAELLEVLASAYLSGAQRAQASEDWMATALRWACEPVRGAAAPLMPDAAEIGHLDGYRVTDILVQHVQKNVDRPVIPENQWTLLIDHAAPNACLAIGSTAHAKGQHRHAERAWRRAFEDGSTSAAALLGLLLFQRGDVVEARACWEHAVEADGLARAAAIGNALFRRGEGDEARSWWQRAVEAGGPPTASAIGHGLFAQGEAEEARAWWTRATEAGGPPTAAAIGYALIEQGEAEEARIWWARAVEDGRPTMAAAIGQGLFERGEAEEARAWWTRATEAGGPSVAITIGNGLFERGEAEEARAWWTRATEAGGPETAIAIGDKHFERGDVEEARAWWTRATEAGGPDAAIVIGYGLFEQGQAEETLVWWTRAFEAGGSSAAITIGNALIERGEAAAARVWWARAAAASRSEQTRGAHGDGGVLGEHPPPS
ncbi:tetratricopeptide repeat protein [Streptomyces mirabilis]|uniref:tetratricopeptide repeat protein n=1 Tax=Streptomyces mirabilis TaxID=68239 RepID=UPI0036D82BCC